MNDDVALEKKLSYLRLKHSELDDMIDAMSSNPHKDEMQYMRCKKERLSIKTEIMQLEQVLYPDIIA